MKQFHWLLCVAKNRNWSRKIAPLSNLTRASLLVELTAKTELNCEIYYNLMAYLQEKEEGKKKIAIRIICKRVA